MTAGPSSPEAPPTPDRPAPARWQVPRLDRRRRLLGGVAAAIAAEIGVEPVWVRAGFVLVAAAGGWGVLLYALLWLALSLHELRAPATPYVAEPKGANATNRLLGVGLVAVGLATFFRSLGSGIASSFTGPVGLAGIGALVAWHRGAFGLGRGTPRAAVARIAAGLALAAVGVVVFAVSNFDLAQASTIIAVTTAVVAGLALVAGPWALQVVTDLSDERRQRIRSEERARVAAHLHDSVLQTLALIQRSADDPGRMTSLARRQERELRAWLYGAGAGTADGAASNGGGVERRLRAELERVAGEVEELCAVPVEVVVVGDTVVDAAIEELLAAAREAMVNAAKHSGAPRVDVYVEARPDAVEVFVRDTGCGFDPAAVPADRVGLSSSIRTRMERIGGNATVDTAPGDGTEIELRLPRSTS